MRVLMYGWEFAPMFSGGLGVVCKSLTEQLLKQNVNVTFVVPKKLTELQSGAKIISAEDHVRGLKTIEVNSPLTPYLSQKEYAHVWNGTKDAYSKSLYGEQLYQEVNRYTKAAEKIATTEQFDIIHAHDWMTYQAGIVTKQITKKPLIVHIHNTVFDRGGCSPNEHEYAIEKLGFMHADKIIAVSAYTKRIVVEKYGIAPEKIEVIHNAVDYEEVYEEEKPFKNKKIVLFLGRVTLQKGPDYFLQAAKEVLRFYPDVKFVIAGSGDMQGKLIHQTAELGIAQDVLFTGALNRKDAYKAFRMAHVYVMPSVSEPFGVTPLEAAIQGTPSIISKTTGVQEVLPHAVRVDFWDVKELANKIIGMLRYSVLRETVQEHISQDMHAIGWEQSARRCQNVYQRVARGNV